MIKIDWEEIAEDRQCEIDEWNKIIVEAAELRGDGEILLPKEYLRELLKNEARLGYINYQLREKLAERGE